MLETVFIAVTIPIPMEFPIENSHVVVENARR